jgi:hypothetical protein
MKYETPVAGPGADSRDFAADPGEADTFVGIVPSAAVAALIERLRTRFGMAVAVVDARLSPVPPLHDDYFHAALADSAEARRRAIGVLKNGRAEMVVLPGGNYLVQPLRAQGRSRRPVGLLAVGVESVQAGQRAPASVDGWADMLRTVLEADFAASAALAEERNEARRATAALRFVSGVGTLGGERDLIRAVIHAAAVWFDVDARIYRKNLSGEYWLHAHLPGIEQPAASSLSSSVVPPAGQTRRIAAGELPAEFRWSAGDVILLTLEGTDDSDWVLALGGHVPPSSETLVTAIAQALGAELTRGAQERLERVRAALYKVTTNSDAPQLIGLTALRHLIEFTGGTAGVLTLHTEDGVRRLAAYGSAQPIPAVPREPLFADDQLVYPMRIGPTRTAVIDVRGGAPFTPDAARVLMAAVQILHPWLVGQDWSTAAADASLAAATGFTQRIAEELERAKRFDLGLAVVVIDFDRAAGSRTIDRMLPGVRAELRGSDLLGVLDDTRIAALLVHTDAAGITSVVPRLRRRVADLTKSLGVPVPRLGRAVFSQECRSAASLLSTAMQNLEVVDQRR